MAHDGGQRALPGGGATLEITLVTPRGEVTHRAVDAITARGLLGELGVLPGHIPYLTMLATGVLTLSEAGNRTVYAHGPGYLEVGESGKVEALVEQVVPATEVDVTEAQADLAAAETAQQGVASTEDPDWKNLEARRAWAQARLTAAAART
jgi:F-type H+-transporting ATPase subunit epsilon